ncbi:MAG: hypothetical protein P8M72_00310 [Gammaproteobacteria bacterium]|nr:hypothetical protein [Gammaproteobacteria bacterium]
MRKSVKQSLLPVLLILVAIQVMAQPQGEAQSAREAAPIDFIGYWVALVTEDWRYRMLTAPVGDFEGIGLTSKGREIANAWDPEADLESGNACKAYGVGGLMRIPTRLNITWASDNILQIDTDAGMQTRLVKFGDAQDTVGTGSLQGVTNAQWLLEREGRFGPVIWGSIEAETTDMAPGYLRRNGVPYGAQAQLKEYFELLVGGDGTEYLTVISILDDPEHLSQLFTTSTNFKRETNGSNWNPTECLVR